MKHLFCILTFTCLSFAANAAQPDSETDLLATGLEEKVATIAGHALGSAGIGSVIPGVSLAEGISEVTGVAISPLLGISAVGAWKYWHTEVGARLHLPWYCQPWAWGTGLGIISLCFLKDIFGAAVPGIFKKPLDWVELFENKASALVALVALVMSEYQRIHPEQLADAFAGSGLAMMPLANVVEALLASPWITVPLSLALFGMVWLTSHAIHVLIALSPFGLIDTGLKLLKLGVLALLTVCAAMIHTISPVPALVLCGIIAIISALLARWSFRLLVFGGVMVSDLLFGKKSTADEIRAAGTGAFLARSHQGIPSRSYGRIETDASGGAVFVRRPWLVLPARRVPLPADGLVLCKGILHPSLGHRRAPDVKPVRLCYLLPRYRGVEDSLAARLRCSETLDSALVRGFKAMRQWFTDVTAFAADTSPR
jgi:hypothetical protein